MRQAARQGMWAEGGAASALTGAIAAVALLYVFRSVLWPFALAMVIAILIQAFKRAVLGLWPRANPALVLAASGVGAVGLMLVAGVIFISGLSPLVGELPLLQQRIDALLGAWSDRAGLEDPILLGTLLGQVDKRAAAAWALGSARGAATGLVLTALFLTFLLFTWNLIARRIGLAAGGERSGPAEVVARSIRGVESYLWIQTVAGLIATVAAGAVMFAVGLDHWPFWAVALFLFSYIPFLGIAVGSIVPALFALLQPVGDPGPGHLPDHPGGGVPGGQPAGAEDAGRHAEHRPLRQPAGGGRLEHPLGPAGRVPGGAADAGADAPDGQRPALAVAGHHALPRRPSAHPAAGPGPGRAGRASRRGARVRAAALSCRTGPARCSRADPAKNGRSRGVGCFSDYRAWGPRSCETRPGAARILKTPGFRIG